MQIRQKHIPFFVVASVLFGWKTYIVYRFLFDMDIENVFQEIILFVNPFIVAFIFFGCSIFFTSSKRAIQFISYGALFGTIILYINVVFHRSYTDFITIPQLFQTSNFVDLSSSIFSLIHFIDIFILVDVLLIFYISKRIEPLHIQFTKRKKMIVMTIGLLLLSANLLLAEISRPQLLTRGFDREYLVKNIGVFYFHLYDVVMQSKNRVQVVLADSNDIKEVKNYINDEIRSDKVSPLDGIAKDKNLIFISAESLQSFVIDSELHGEEITPFLNSLIKDEDSYYFDNFYHQTEQGKTSDSEFVVENSLYPLTSGAVFFTHAQNEYHSLSEMLTKADYRSLVMHANDESFWNRNQMYEQLNIDEFYDIDSYDVTKENSVGWGLKDKEFFNQSIPYLMEETQPFYVRLITITNHFPFELDEADRSLEPFDSNSDTLNNYFPTVRYMDEAIEEFFTQLKISGLYEDSIIVIMGDHDGISANHNKAMAMYLEKEEITPYDYVQLQRVPFIVHIPGHGEGETISKIGGQIDVKPTMLHMLGVDTSKDIYFGNDLFHDDRKGYIARLNGSFVSDDYVYAAGVCYDRESGEPIVTDSEMFSEETACAPFVEKIEAELNFSNSIIYGNLFRFVNFAK